MKIEDFYPQAMDILARIARVQVLGGHEQRDIVASALRAAVETELADLRAENAKLLALLNRYRNAAREGGDC